MTLTEVRAALMRAALTAQDNAIVAAMNGEDYRAQAASGRLLGQLIDEIDRLNESKDAS